MLAALTFDCSTSISDSFCSSTKRQCQLSAINKADQLFWVLMNGFVRISLELGVFRGRMTSVMPLYAVRRLGFGGTQRNGVT